MIGLHHRGAHVYTGCMDTNNTGRMSFDGMPARIAEQRRHQTALARMCSDDNRRAEWGTCTDCWHIGDDCHCHGCPHIDDGEAECECDEWQAEMNTEAAMAGRPPKTTRGETK